MVNRLTAWLPGLLLILLVQLSFSMWRRPPGPVSSGVGLTERIKVERGALLSFRPNRQLDIHAIEVKTAEKGMLTLDFRPQMAKTLMSVAGPGDPVEVGYAVNPADEGGGYRLYRVRNLRTGKEVALDKLPHPPDIPPDRNAEHFMIDLPTLVSDEYGEVVGIRSGSNMFHLKSALVDDILPQLKNAGQLGLSAVRRDDQLGLVNADHDKVYIVLSITIDDKTYLVR